MIARSVFLHFLAHSGDWGSEIYQMRVRMIGVSKVGQWISTSNPVNIILHDLVWLHIDIRTLSLEVDDETISRCDQGMESNQPEQARNVEHVFINHHSTISSFTKRTFY